MKRGRGWPIAIAVVLGALVVSNVWIAVVASDPRALAMEPDYYRKALAWDDAVRQDAANRALGWSLHARLGDSAGARLRVELRDRSGRPLTGASVQLTALHNREANRPTVATLRESAPGWYDDPAPFRRPGQWELRFVVQRGAVRFTADERVDVPGAAR